MLVHSWEIGLHYHYHAAVKTGTEIEWHCEFRAEEWSCTSRETVVASSVLENFDSLSNSSEPLHPPTIEVSWGQNLGFCKNKLRTALLVIKILFHRHVFVEYNSLDFMIFTTPNRSNKKDYSFHYYHRDKLNEKLLTPLCYFNFRWDNRPF